MKKTACILMCLLFLTGCGGKAEVMPHEKDPTTVVPDQIEGVWMAWADGTLSSSGMRYSVGNVNNGRRLTYGEDFTLQVKDGDEWYDLTANPPENFAFSAIGYELDGETETERDHALNWTMLYGELPPGQYRMLKEMIWEGTVMYPTLALEFEIEA